MLQINTNQTGNMKIKRTVFWITLLFSVGMLIWSVLVYINYSIAMRYEVIDAQIILGNSSDIIARENEIRSIQIYTIFVALLCIVHIMGGVLLKSRRYVYPLLTPKWRAY